jgi:mono/diheme cytochrome c family protein
MATKPVDNKGWKAIKSDSLILAESCNLLFARLPEEDAAAWAQHATASRIGGSELYQAAGEKDFAKANSAYRKMLDNCNACHRQFENGKHILVP